MPKYPEGPVRGVVLDAYQTDVREAIRSLRVAERTLPALKAGQVLVRVEAAPCNPSDLLFLTGRYGRLKSLPSVPGWEGAGIVVASGGGLYGRWLQGKRVACTQQRDRDGTWAEYVVANVSDCIPVSRKISSEQAACLIVNPLTAVALLETARRGAHKAAIHTAGASQLGRMMLAISRRTGYPMIHVVRRDPQEELLRSLGAEHVLNMTHDDFEDRLRELAGRLKATLAFEAVAGPLTGTVVNAMPPRSTALVYGALSERGCGHIDPVGLIFYGKTVTGFFLATWMRELGLWGRMRVARRVQQYVIDGTIQTKIQRRLALEEVPEGLEQYVLHMTDGKVLIGTN